MLLNSQAFHLTLVSLDGEKLTPIIKYKETYSEITGNNISEITAIANNSTTSKPEKAASASDFIRLVWAFTLALRSCADKITKPHLGLIIMDEPQQHSMSNESVRSLFAECSACSEQTIIAASFDCSEENYKQITNGINFYVVNFKGKLLQRIS